MARRIVVAGASRGIGAAVAAHYTGLGDDVVSLSRSPSPTGRWLRCDLSRAEDIAQTAEDIGGGPIDALIYAGGTWEEGAFTSAYSFPESPVPEILNVLAVNLAGAILLTRALLPALSKADPGRVILLGSTSGLENAASREVANSASKYGLRGAAHALNASLRDLGVPVTVIDPGNVATDEVLADIETGAFPPQTAIPMADILAAMDFALSLSRATVAQEISLYQTNP